MKWGKFITLPRVNLTHRYLPFPLWSPTAFLLPEHDFLVVLAVIIASYYLWKSVCTLQGGQMCRRMYALTDRKPNCVSRCRLSICCLEPTLRLFLNLQKAPDISHGCHIRVAFLLYFSWAPARQVGLQIWSPVHLPRLLVWELVYHWISCPCFTCKFTGRRVNVK